MRIVHKKTLWVHSAYALIVCGVLGLIIWSQPNIPNIVVVALIAAYIIGHIYIHFKRDDLRQDTVAEYVLIGIAVTVVLAGALNN